MLIQKILTLDVPCSLIINIFFFLSYSWSFFVALLYWFKICDYDILIDFLASISLLFLQGFDEYMNLVLDEAEEVSIKKNTRKQLGESFLFLDSLFDNKSLSLSLFICYLMVQ